MYWMVLKRTVLLQSFRSVHTPCLADSTVATRTAHATIDQRVVGMSVVRAAYAGVRFSQAQRCATFRWEAPERYGFSAGFSAIKSQLKLVRVDISTMRRNVADLDPMVHGTEEQTQNPNVRRPLPQYDCQIILRVVFDDSGGINCILARHTRITAERSCGQLRQQVLPYLRSIKHFPIDVFVNFAMTNVQRNRSYFDKY